MICAPPVPARRCREPSKCIVFTRKVELPIEPPPNPVSAAETTGKVFDWAEATGETFKKTNQNAQQFPLWQELQLLGFIR
jgi:hypothetical protein